MQINEFNQPIGDAVPHFSAGEKPSTTLLRGRYCRLEKLNATRHLDDLWAVYGNDSALQHWTYLPPHCGRFEEKSAFAEYLQNLQACEDPYTFVIFDNAQNCAVGTVSLMRIDTANRVVEVGYVIYSAQLQCSRLATEAQFLLASYVFDTLKYRRYEWKCDSLNAPSRNAALRLGFTFEGIFRQAVVYKGRNRDTAWFSMLDSEWQAVKKRFEAWLSPSNFDENGKQKVRLQDC